MNNSKLRTIRKLPRKIKKDINPTDISIIINKKSTDRKDVIFEIQYTLEIPIPTGILTLGTVNQKINIIGRWTKVSLPFPINSANNLQTSGINFAIQKFDSSDRQYVPHNGNRTRVLYETGRQGYVTIEETIIQLLKDKPGILGQRAVYTVTME